VTFVSGIPAVLMVTVNDPGSAIVRMDGVVSCVTFPPGRLGGGVESVPLLGLFSA